MHDYAETAAMDAFTSSKYRGHPTELAKLHGARLVTATETEEGRAWAEARIKQITGGDKIAARFMRQDEFTFRPQFQLMFSGNHRPKLQNVDDAMRRRLIMIPFENRPKRKDTKLTEKLKAEWPGILRWMIDGCMGWQSHGLDAPRAVTAATNDYFETEDIFGQFLEANVEDDLTATKLDSDRLFGAWMAHAKKIEEAPRDKRWFLEEMRKRDYQSRKSNGKTVFDRLRLLQPKQQDYPI